MRSRRRSLLAAAAAVAALAVPAAAAAAPLAPADQAFVDSTVAQLMQQERLPGVALRITGPKGDYEHAYGVSDTAAGTPMALDDHVRIASITKTFTATAILRQVARGRIALSDPLSRWVKGVPNGRRITVRQLLAMRSGIYDFTADPAFDAAFAANPTMSFRPADILPIIRRHKPDFAPGARTQYADSNYVLLGMILERVTGRSAASAITRDVIRPAGLRDTSYPTTPAIPAPFSHGYYAGDDGSGPLQDFTAVNPAVAGTAGAMISTLDDLQTWGRELATGTLLPKALQRQRLRFGRIANPRGPFAGYGLGILRFGDWVGHNGAIFGFSTVTFRDRTTGAQIVAEANLSSNSSTPTMDLFGLIAQHLYPASLRTS
jgi:D-alanyl-D-alanine carboxypeptidase